MALLTYKPKPPLSEFVEVLWLSEGYAPSHEQERLLPDGTVELVINLKEDRIRLYDRGNCKQFFTIPGCVVSGPRSEFFIIDTDTQASTIGVHFKPGGASPFLKAPASEISNQSVALECLWGAGSSRLRERLLEAKTAAAKFLVLERCLLQQLAKPAESHPVIAFAVQQLFARNQPPTVSHLVEQVGFSQRHFIQLFSEEVGLTPKLFSRVGRFQRVIQTIHAKLEIDWTDMALSCGYYDQAHFIHDFQSFAGITPTDYLARKTEHVNHVPLLG